MRQCSTGIGQALRRVEYLEEPEFGKHESLQFVEFYGGLVRGACRWVKIQLGEFRKGQDWGVCLQDFEEAKRTDIRKRRRERKKACVVNLRIPPESAED